MIRPNARRGIFRHSESGFSAGRCHRLTALIVVLLISCFSCVHAGLAQSAPTAGGEEPINSSTAGTIKSLLERATLLRQSVAKHTKYVDELRELARSARDNAARIRDSAWKANWIESAERREAEAARIGADLPSQLARAQEMEDRAKRLQARLDEQEAALRHEREKMQAEDAERERRDTERKRRAEHEPKWSVFDLHGLWGLTNDPETTIAVVPKDPERPENLDVEVHTSTRVWHGTFEPDSPSGPAKAVFNYVPKAEEMSAKIPEPARRAVAGTLKWRLELELSGLEHEPNLEAKLFAGDVRWSEASPSNATVLGEGEPELSTYLPIDIDRIESVTSPTVTVKLPNPGHNALFDPIEALIKGQQFFVQVILPAELARKRGPNITAKVRSKSGGGEESVKLTGDTSNTTRPVVYSHVDPVTIDDCDPLTSPRRTPQWMSLSWIVGHKGECLNIKVANKELIEVSFEEAAFEVPVYSTWVQRGIERHKEGAARLRAFYEAVRAGSIEYPTGAGPVCHSGSSTVTSLSTGTSVESQACSTPKQAAEKRLRMLSNYEALVQSEKLTDLHRFFVGEVYLGDQSPALLQSTEAEILVQHNDDRLNAPTQREQGTDPEFYNPLVKAMLEGFLGQDLSPKAHHAGDPILWTSEAERFYVVRAIQSTSKRLGERAIQSTYENLTFGMYDGLVMAPLLPDVPISVGAVYLILSGEDHFGRPQPAWVRVMTAVTIASGAVLKLAGPTAAQLFLSRVVRVSSRMAPVAGATGKFASSLVSKTLIARSSRVARTIEGIVEPPNVPRSVNPAQRAGLTRDFKPDGPAGEAVRCSRNPTAVRKPPSLLDPSLARRAAGPGNLDDTLPDPIPTLPDPISTEIKLYLKETWGPHARIVNPDGPLLLELQKGGNCQARVIVRAYQKATGTKLTEVEERQILQAILEVDRKTGRRAGRTDIRQDVGNLNHWLGYDNKSVRDFARFLNGKAVEPILRTPGLIGPVEQNFAKLNRRIRLRDIHRWLSNKWMVKAVVDFTAKEGDDFHAVLVEGLVIKKSTREIVAVRVFDSNVGRIIEVPHKHFKKVLNGNRVQGHAGNITLLRFDAD